MIGQPQSLVTEFEELFGQLESICTRAQELECQFASELAQVHPRFTHSASDETGKECKIVMDLAGSKIRTGDLQPGPGVVRIRPRRDALGRVLSPKRIRFVPEDSQWCGKKPFFLPVPQQCIELTDVGAEITDAAMSQCADCVMLNKGPHIIAAIRMLDNILRRMQNHQHKKTARLRKLSITEF